MVPGCPTSFHEFGDYCYFGSDSQNNDQDIVEAWCDSQSPGSHLVSIHSSSEASWIDGWFTDGRFWTGLTYERAMEWESGTLWQYSNWDYDEPNDGDASLR